MDCFKVLLVDFMITCLIVLAMFQYVGNWMKCLEIICFCNNYP